MDIRSLRSLRSTVVRFIREQIVVGGIDLPRQRNSPRYRVDRCPQRYSVPSSFCLGGCLEAWRSRIGNLPPA
jgi:hypothetical protein